MPLEGREPRVVRDVEQEFGGRRFRLTLVLSDEPPPATNIATAHCLAFDGADIVLARHVERQWTIPGGHLDPGETAEQAMRREAMEEAGIEVGAAFVIGHELIRPLEPEAADTRYPNPSFQVFFLTSVRSWHPITDTDECTESRTFSPAEARITVGWIRQHRDFYEAALRRVTGEESVHHRAD